VAKIVEGVAMVAAGVALAFIAPELVITDAMFQFLESAAVAIGAAGASLTFAGIAQALQAGPSMPFSVRQTAAPRQIVYGECRVAGIIVYMSTTNNGHDLNQVIAWAGHQVQSIDTIYIDGRAIHIPANGGQDNGNTYYDDSNNQYSFGSGVTAWNSLGPVPGTYFSDLGSRDGNWDNSCTLDGIAASYVRTSYNPNLFSGLPGIKANIHGKCDIYDPRTSTYGYTNNAALVIADFLCNPDFGLGCNYATEIDQAQLIAAANLCDEQVALAAGGTESRYTINGFFDTNSTPGDVLDAMLASCEGRISYSGGTWKIYPAAWYGSGLTFDANDLIGPVKWVPRRKYRDVVNAVRATYISPKYPYAVVGYSQDHKDPNIWSGQWQPTDIPEYAQDALHGYVSDANLANDGNVKLYATRSYRFVTSVAMAQRLAKIYLLRNRQEGSGTLQMSLAAYQCIAQDVIQVSFPALGWISKYLEVQSLRFVPKSDPHNQEAPSLYVEMDVSETDPSVYLWSTAEERGVLNTTSPAIYNAMQVNPPTNLTLESGSDSAVNGADGIVIPRIHVSWIEPDDPFVLSGGSVELQWQKQGDSGWHSAGYFDANVTDYFLTGVVCGQQYNVQMRAVRSNGATSGWVSAGPHTVSQTLSSVSYANVSGLGALATKNFVDFATGDVANRTASNLTYSNSLSVEALRPAQPNADQTAGKSIDILADGTVYVRTKASQSQGGYITGKSYGHNVLGNYGFESDISGTAAGDEWSASSAAIYTVYRDSAIPHTGDYALCILLDTNVAIPTYAECRVKSTPIPIQGGQPLFFGGAWRWDWSVGVPTGLTLTARIGLWFTDANGNNVGEAEVGDVVNQGGLIGWTESSAMANAPSNAAFVQMECCAFASCGSPVWSGPNIFMQLRFDDVFLTMQLTSSGMLNAQGSIMPNQPISINYSSTNSGVSFSWGQQSMLRSDGSTLNIPAGSSSFSSLASSTTYYTYWYVRVSDGTLQMTNGNPPPTSPSAYMAAQAGLDGRIPISPISFTTLAAGNGGSSGGTGGGANTCPESAELVDVQGKGQIEAGAVKAGDMIRGKNCKTGADVYRKVLQVAAQSCAAWRVVDGHRVSPCEPVYFNGEWMPAYRASAQADEYIGKKVLITVEADSDSEHNYYLVAGDALLIHNWWFSPC